MTILDSVFTGTGGVTATIYRLFAGEATLIIETAPRYDEETDSYTSATREQTVPFLAGGMVESKGADDGGRAPVHYEFSGSIPSASCSGIPLKSSRLRYKGDLYEITSVQPNIVGSQTDRYELKLRKM